MTRRISRIRYKKARALRALIGFPVEVSTQDGPAFRVS